METKKLKRNREEELPAPVEVRIPSQNSKELSCKEKLEKLIQAMAKEERNRQDGQCSFSSSCFLSIIIDCF